MISTKRQREMIQQLAELVQYRAAQEKKIDEIYRQEVDACRAATQAEIDRQTEGFRKSHAALNSKYMGRLETARRHYETVTDRVAKQRSERMSAIESEYSKAIESNELECRQSQALAERDCEQDIQIADTVAQQAKENITSEFGQLNFLRDEGAQLLRRRGIRRDLPDGLDTNPDATTEVLLRRYRDAARAAAGSMAKIRQHVAVRFVDEGWPVLLFIALLVLIGFPMGMSQNWTGWVWIAATILISIVGAIAARQICALLGNRATRATSAELEQQIGTASISLQHAKDMVDVERRARHDQLQTRRDDAITAAKLRWEEEASRLQRQREAEENGVEQQLAQQEQASRLAWDKEAKECRDTFPPKMEQEKQEHEQVVQRLEFERDNRLTELANRHAAEWEQLVHRWRTGISDFTTEVQQQNDYLQERFPHLPDVSWQSWKPANDVPLALPFGDYQVDLANFPGGLPAAPQLAVTNPFFQLPAVVAYPGEPSLLIEAEGDGRDRAVQAFQQIMLRLLTSFPAGKIRFTIIDPTGLGQNFSAFMHLADFDERLVTNRIWTETNHINQRLTDLTEHMENVIQKYLRNEFSSIQDYNQHAGEVAEPFQVLVVANFPANFSDEATRRLTSIATSGARCGVFTMISADTKMKFPRNFDLADLEAAANTLVWQSETEQFAWHDETLREFPLRMRPTESDELTTNVIRVAGELAIDANRVEVPFETVAPSMDQWWSDDSRHQIEVALGRAGATKLQYMTLGKGTSQHVLVAGKTGSGKSTMMHAMITNLALHYSPEEIQFYLVDFKKGVEFKTYAEHQLPHAKVVAIESEREFGLSVLQRLDEELTTRGDIFRQAGVQTIGAYRDNNPQAIMPRIMLVVDEFQEFFVNDDKIANESSLLLDRLVRQGRAFGIHVLLGSQTLAGAYSLARSTLGQMAVRIALQCSEADAHLILSEDNTAARLLSRPGEAIYNNANGLFEGNSPFQVVWLPDAMREDFLQRLSQLARQRAVDPQRPIVFEGNAAAKLSENRALQAALNGSPAKKVAAWLGAAVAIKEPTAITMRRQAGNHLLAVGQNEELADGVLSAAIVGLTATASGVNREPPSVVVLDGGRFDAAEINMGARLARALPSIVQSIPTNEADAAVADLYEEVKRRTEGGSDQQPQRFLMIYNLARFRQLRRDEDDFGMSFGDEEQTLKPAKQFAHILQEGPAVGVHVLLWCDSYNNLSRWLDRQSLREFAWRVLFQMSPTDSSNLMDSTAATHLGQYRAMLYDDERGEFEKFQPYGPPTMEFLESVAQRL